jgi:membrane dipeptidase
MPKAYPFSIGGAFSMDEQIMVADAHCDFLFNMAVGIQKIDDDPEPMKHITLRSLHEGRVGLQVFAVWTDEMSGAHPLVNALECVDCFHQMIENSGGKIVHADRNQVSKRTWESVTTAVLALEGGECLLGSQERLELFLKKGSPYRRYVFDDQRPQHLLQIFSRLGVKAVALTWNHKNALACGAAVKKDTGVTPEGRMILQEMEKSNIALDVSHLGRKSFWDALGIYSRPVMASHSNADLVCRHERNLDDTQIKAIIGSGGFIGVCYFPKFIGSSSATPEDICRHIDHMVSLGGENCVGLGSDFDGIKTMPQGISGPTDVQRIFEGLEKLGYTEPTIKKIAYGNLADYIIKFL